MMVINGERVCRLPLSLAKLPPLPLHTQAVCNAVYKPGQGTLPLLRDQGSAAVRARGRNGGPSYSLGLFCCCLFSQTTLRRYCWQCRDSKQERTGG